MDNWRTRAACLNADPNLFFLAKGDSLTGKFAAAKAVCDTCPVQPECLEYACTRKLIYGIWGGTTYNQRRLLWQQNIRPKTTTPRSRP